MLLTLTAEVVWHCPYSMLTARPLRTAQRCSTRSTFHLDLWPKGRRPVHVGHADDTGWAQDRFADCFTICFCTNIIIIIIKRILLKCRPVKKISKNAVELRQYQIKTGAAQFSAVPLVKGNSKKMCLQPAPEAAECLWDSDAVTLDGKLFRMRGAATKNARSPICRTTRWRCYESSQIYTDRWGSAAEWLTRYTALSACSG